MTGKFDFLASNRGEGFTSASAHPELISGDLAIPPRLQVSFTALPRSQVQGRRRAPVGILVATVACGALCALVFFFEPFQPSAAEISKRLDDQCAKRDALFMLQLEQHGESGEMPGEKLYAAYRDMLRARTACSQGRAEDGLALYDSHFDQAAASR
jgi:hypothetical protein